MFTKWFVVVDLNVGLRSVFWKMRRLNSHIFFGIMFPSEYLPVAAVLPTRKFSETVGCRISQCGVRSTFLLSDSCDEMRSKARCLWFCLFVHHTTVSHQNRRTHPRPTDGVSWRHVESLEKIQHVNRGKRGDQATPMPLLPGDRPICQSSLRPDSYDNNNNNNNKQICIAP